MSIRRAKRRRKVCLIGIEDDKEAQNYYCIDKTPFIEEIATTMLGKSIDIPTISSLLQEYILQSYSYYDLKDEKSYQIMLTGILAVLFDTHIVKAEVNSPKGRCDIMVSPKQKGGLGIIFEIKCHRGAHPLSRERLRESASSAIRQIEKKDYALGLRQRQCKKALLYGIAFDVSGAHCLESKEL